jgi:hypothetical protein
MAQRGRPSSYTPEMGEKICEQIARGITLREVCSEEGMPGEKTVRIWALTHEEFRPMYARAREERVERWADEIVEISDDGRNDWMDRANERGEVTQFVDHEHISRSKLRIDTRKWLMSRILPGKYGDKVEISGNRDNPLVVDCTPRDMSKALGLIVEELRARQIEGTLADVPGDEA